MEACGQCITVPCSSFLLGLFPFSSMGPPQSSKMNLLQIFRLECLQAYSPALMWDCPQAAGKYPLYHGPFHQWQANLCSSPWGTSSLSFFSDLSVCRIASHTFFLSPHCLCDILFFLKYVFPKVPSAWLMLSAMSCGVSVLDLAVVWHGAASGSSHGGLLLQLLCCQHLDTYTQ